MSRTVRLEGLSVAVNPHDLRLYFRGLEIPEGGITIIGGKRGVAYVSFTTWEDARRAIEFSGLTIKDSIVLVYPSSTAEMEQSLIKYESAFFSRNGDHADRDLDRRDTAPPRASVYLRITVTAGVTTSTSVRKYFAGLQIADIVSIKDDHALRNGALVKFSTSTDASEGVRRHRNSKDVDVVWSNEREWVKHGGKVFCDGDNRSYSSRHDRRLYSRSPERSSWSPHRSRSSHRSRSPHYFRSPRHSRSPQPSRSPRKSRSPLQYSRAHHLYNVFPWWHSESGVGNSRSPRLRSRSPHTSSRSPRRHTRSPQNATSEHDPIYDGEFHVHVTNLSYTTRKDDLRKWFFNLVNNDHIKFLYDEKGRRTRECFVTFKNEKDYKRVLRLDKVTFNGRLLFITSVSKPSMRNLLTGKEALFSHHHTKGKCLYLRNFPSHVTKSDIQKFFAGFSLNEEDISMLCDGQGFCLGEVLVSFSSEEELERAEKLHRKKFKDKEIPLRRIPEDKLQSFLCANSISLVPEDPYDCVTQEDDVVDEDDDLEKNTPEDDNQDDNILNEDSCFHQTDNTHECVTQEDDTQDDVCVEDGPGDSAVHVDNGPDDAAVSEDHGPDDTTVSEDHGPDDTAVNEGDGPDDTAVNEGDGPDDTAVNEGDGPDDTAVNEGDGPDDTAVNEGDGPDDTAVNEGDGPDDTAVKKGDGPDDTAVNECDGPDDTAVKEGDGPHDTAVKEGAQRTDCGSDEINTHADNDMANPKGASLNDDELWANVFVANNNNTLRF